MLASEHRNHAVQRRGRAGPYGRFLSGGPQRRPEAPAGLASALSAFLVLASPLDALAGAARRAARSQGAASMPPLGRLPGPATLSLTTAAIGRGPERVRDVTALVQRVSSGGLVHQGLARNLCSHG